MMDKQFSKRTRFLSGQHLVLCGVLLTVAGCQAVSPDQGASTSSAEAIASDSGPSSATADFPLLSDDTSSESLSDESPEVASASPKLPPGNLPPDIVPATTEANRLPQVHQGRRSPFDALPTTPYIVRTSAQPAQSSPPNALVTARPNPTIPPVPIASAPHAVVPVPLAVPPAPINAVPVPSGSSVNAPLSSVPVNSAEDVSATTEASDVSASDVLASASPDLPSTTSPSLTIEFSGVVQMGDRVSLIVKEPGVSSRYVYVGDTIANGRYVVKAVDFNRGPTPAVILDQAGIESVHWVGSLMESRSGI